MPPLSSCYRSLICLIQRYIPAWTQVSWRCLSCSPTQYPYSNVCTLVQRSPLLPRHLELVYLVYILPDDFCSLCHSIRNETSWRGSSSSGCNLHHIACLWVRPGMAVWDSIWAPDMTLNMAATTGISPWSFIRKGFVLFVLHNTKYF